MQKITDPISHDTMRFGFTKNIKCPACGNTTGIAGMEADDKSAIYWCLCDTIFDATGHIRDIHRVFGTLLWPEGKI